MPDPAAKVADGRRRSTQIWRRGAEGAHDLPGGADTERSANARRVDVASPDRGTALATTGYMKKPFVIASSTFVAGAIALLLFLRPTHSISPGPELATPQRIPPAMSSIIRTKMGRHGEQMKNLVSHAVVLDFDGTARAAGEIFDEPALARPIAGDELNGLLPARFFDLQDAMRAQARVMVDAAARRNSKAVADSFGALAKSCIGCHDAYLTGSSE